MTPTYNKTTKLRQTIKALYTTDIGLDSNPNNTGIADTSGKPAIERAYNDTKLQLILLECL